MSWHGDIRLGDTIDIKFTTVATTGAPTTLAGSPVVAAYVGNGTTEITAGITLSVDFDGRTGLHNVRVVASSGNGFATATNVSLVLTAGTVGGTSVVGYEAGSFSIENRKPLSVGSIETGGIVAASFAASAITATAIATDAITAAKIAADAITAAKIATGAITAAKFAAGAIDAAAIATDAIGAAELAADAVAEIAAAVSSGGVGVEVIMLGYVGDLNPGAVVDLKFVTKFNGIATTLAGSPVISLYKDNSVTQSTVGVTLTVDFDGVTGLHNLRITTSADGTFYSGGSNFVAIITTGTVGGASAVGRAVGALSLRARASLYPTTANATLDVQPDGSIVSNAPTAVQIGDEVQTRTLAAVTTVVNKTGYELSPAGVAAIWAAATRTLTSFGTLTTDVVAALAASFAAVGTTVLDAVVEGAMTVRGTFRLANSANAGKTSGMVAPGTPGTAHLRDLADTKDRVVATFDANGNRTTATTDVT